MPSGLDSVEVSLLTCSPGTEVYSLYGHTAIRVKSYTRGRTGFLITVCSASTVRILYGALRAVSAIIRLAPCLLLTLPRNMKSVVGSLSASAEPEGIGEGTALDAVGREYASGKPGISL